MLALLLAFWSMQQGLDIGQAIENSRQPVVKESPATPKGDPTPASPGRQAMAAYITARNPALDPTHAQEVADLIWREAERYGIDPWLAAALAAVESNFRANAYSQKGAIGMFQVMPSTAPAVGHTVETLWNWRANVNAGVHYLALMLQRFGDVTLALAAYNAGPTLVAATGGIPEYGETQEHVRRVLAEHAQLQTSIVRAAR